MGRYLIDQFMWKDLVLFILLFVVGIGNVQYVVVGLGVGQFLVVFVIVEFISVFVLQQCDEFCFIDKLGVFWLCCVCYGGFYQGVEVQCQELMYVVVCVVGVMFFYIRVLVVVFLDFMWCWLELIKLVVWLKCWVVFSVQYGIY